MVDALGALFLLLGLAYSTTLCDLRERIDPFDDLRDTLARHGVDVSHLRMTDEARTTLASVLAVVLGAAGIGVAWWIYSARRAPAPKPSRAVTEKRETSALGSSG